MVRARSGVGGQTRLQGAFHLHQPLLNAIDAEVNNKRRAAFSCVDSHGKRHEDHRQTGNTGKCWPDAWPWHGHSLRPCRHPRQHPCRHRSATTALGARSCPACRLCLGTGVLALERRFLHLDRRALASPTRRLPLRAPALAPCAWRLAIRPRLLAPCATPSRALGSWSPAPLAREPSRLASLAWTSRPRALIPPPGRPIPATWQPTAPGTKLRAAHHRPSPAGAMHLQASATIQEPEPHAWRGGPGTGAAASGMSNHGVRFR